MGSNIDKYFSIEGMYQVERKAEQKDLLKVVQQYQNKDAWVPTLINIFLLKGCIK